MNTLPIDSLLPDLCRALADRDDVMPEAPPGAGKTTRMPLAVLDQPWLAGSALVRAGTDLSAITGDDIAKKFASASFMRLPWR